MTLWHYTIFPTLGKILSDGEIKTTNFCNTDAPVVCLSSNSWWDEGVRKAIMDPQTGEMTKLLTRDELFEKGCPPVRIEINADAVDPHDWMRHHIKKSMPTEVAEKIEKEAIAWGAKPQEWWVSYHNIPLANCLFPIEIWDGKDWRLLLNQRD